ncbi:uncharacterized protein APUU_21285S [Aspergillus puulaauensis]|uniref:Fumarylacetoacetase n=1 Tax=Aspergillus puulaauensis TaxID=1220207 RepID=A0A7R7XH34_9EURO|nr:uncharacterized protein APUU_21285S [Aspergillus puulaauensis]BCS20853.1 hypothetical protein APUU_21285S [Aspergillus puulaauensis]
MTTPFPIDNLPYGVISTADNPTPRCATALDDTAIDLRAIEKDGHFKSVAGFETDIFSQPTLNAFAALPKSSHSQVRDLLTTLLSNADTRPKYAIPLEKVTNHFPMDTKNFSDFYCSLEHTQNCSKIMNISMPSNWFIIPSVYNGRTSSLRISGTPIRRPNGVFPPSSPSVGNNKPTFQPSTRFDFELEIGLFLSRPLSPGSILDIADAPQYIFGMVILNDWSARDIQGFEMVPLGPFHGKGAGTTISPWIVTAEALGACAAAGVKVQDPAPLRHLAWRGRRDEETWDVELTARVVRNGKSYLVTETNLKELYWTPYQQLVHLASAGEGLSTGDIFGTGTVTSERINSNGENMGIACLLERHLPENKLASLTEGQIGFLEDGDEVVMEGWCVNRHTGRRFGFGECSGVVLPALNVDT